MGGEKKRVERYTWLSYGVKSAKRVRWYFSWNKKENWRHSKRIVQEDKTDFQSTRSVNPCKIEERCFFSFRTVVSKNSVG